jgi:RecG-like helicase
VQDTNDGHKVAMEDMSQRGAGELFGQRQSGPACTGLAGLLSSTDLTTDADILDLARTEAAKLVKKYGFTALPAPILAAASAYGMTSLLKTQMQDIDVHM